MSFVRISSSSTVIAVPVAPICGPRSCRWGGWPSLTNAIQLRRVFFTTAASTLRVVTIATSRLGHTEKIASVTTSSNTLVCLGLPRLFVGHRIHASAGSAVGGPIPCPYSDLATRNRKCGGSRGGGHADPGKSKANGSDGGGTGEVKGEGEACCAVTREWSISGTGGPGCIGRSHWGRRGRLRNNISVVPAGQVLKSGLVKYGEHARESPWGSGADIKRDCAAESQFSESRQKGRATLRAATRRGVHCPWAFREAAPRDFNQSKSPKAYGGGAAARLAPVQHEQEPATPRCAASWREGVCAREVAPAGRMAANLPASRRFIAT